MFSGEAWALTLDLRDVLRLVVLSAAIVGVAQVLFQRNAPSRRQFLLWAAALLLVLPWLAGWLNLAIPVGVVELPRWSLDRPVPGWLVWPACAVSLVGLLRVWLAARAQRRSVMVLPTLNDVRLQRLAGDLLEPLGLVQIPQFRLYEDKLNLPQAPFATSKAGGQVVLPADYRQLDSTTLRAVVTHELVHLARRDDWGRLVMRALISLYWFLPWLRGLERDYLDAMEHSCDDRAADFFGPSLSYMEAVVGAVGLQVRACASPGANNRQANEPPTRASSIHPMLHRVLRFGHRREFDADAMRVAGYLGLTLVAGLVFASLEPIAKPQQWSGLVASAGLALPASAAPLPQMKIQTPIVRVTLAQRLNQAPSYQSSLVTSLKALDQPSPIYPGTALRAQLEGEVWVDYLIAMDGSVINPVVVHSEPAGLFESSALATVRRTRYQHLSQYSATPLDFARAGPAASELRVRQRFRYQLQPSY